ncbi:phytoene/squalene synthase family protein [Tundrisphaera sp. TA3]|uniref:phytoene/squalene synthase family protein n=1 Tax=Tundrisphaera sp. TA3 TaxID=3435775 RepID=UPI003EB83E09
MSPALWASYDFCRRLSRREARNFYGSFLLLPADRRRAMCALYAFLRRTDDLADAPGLVADRAASLIAWRAGLIDALAGGRPADGWPGWPALADSVRAYGIPARHLEAVIDGVEMDLEPRPFATFADLQAYCDRVASAVGLCCLHIWGFRPDGDRAERLAEACGRALQLTNILRDVREDARNGRIYLPEDERERFGVSADELAGEAVSPPARALFAFQAERAEGFYRQAEPLVDLVAPVGRPVLLAITGVYRALLAEIVRRDFDVLAGRVSIPGRRKLGIMVGSLAGRFIRPRARHVEVPAASTPIGEPTRCG